MSYFNIIFIIYYWITFLFCYSYVMSIIYSRRLAMIDFDFFFHSLECKGA